MKSLIVWLGQLRQSQDRVLMFAAKVPALNDEIGPIIFLRQIFTKISSFNYYVCITSTTTVVFTMVFSS